MEARMKTGRGTLSRQNIAEAAMALLDREGEAGFSMRRLAAELHVDPMALYHHHKNRHALLTEVLNTLLDECHLPEPGADWKHGVAEICREMRHLAQRHPGAFRVYVYFEGWVASEQRLHEALYATLLAGGFGRRAAIRAVRLLLAYVESFAVDELTGWLAPPDEDEHKGLLAILATGAYPATAGLVDEIAGIDADDHFAYGLDVLLSGLEVDLGRHRP